MIRLDEDCECSPNGLEDGEASFDYVRHFEVNSAVAKFIDCVCAHDAYLAR